MFFIFAMFAAWLYKFVAGFFFGILTYLTFFAFGLSGKSPDEAFIERPKRFFLTGILNHATIGALYSLFIFYVTVYYQLYYGGNYWFYIITSVLWSTTIISGASAFYGVLLATCTLGLISIWLGFGIIGLIIVWIATVLISIAYYFGRIDVIKEQEDDWIS